MIIGNNSAGKTSVLSVAAITLGFLTSSFILHRKPMAISRGDIKHEEKKGGDLVTEFEQKILVTFVSVNVNEEVPPR